MGIIMRNGVSYSGIPTDIESIDFTSSSVGGTTPSQPGATDTYTIALSNGTTSAFTVYNGTDGKDSPTNSDVTMEGNPVILTDLQGEVPFSKITINGDGIVGQEITLTTTGKNQLPITLTNGVGAGVTYTVDNDEITVSGTTTALATIIVSAPNMTIAQDMRLSYIGTLSGITPKATVLRNGELVYPTPNETIGSKLLAGDVLQNVYIQQQEAGIEVSGSARFQLEYGTTVTEYEAYSGETHTFTPDSTEYNVPTNIIQKHGINVIAVGTTDAVVSVIGVGANNAIAKLWNNISQLENIDLGIEYSPTCAFTDMSPELVFENTSSATGFTTHYDVADRVVFGNGKFLKLFTSKPSSSEAEQSQLYMSRDGIKWISTTDIWARSLQGMSGSIYNISGIDFINNQFIMYGSVSTANFFMYSTTTSISYSEDGYAWTNLGGITSVGTITSVIYTGSKYIYSTSTGHILQSTNHSDISSVTQVVSAKLKICKYNDKVVAITPDANIYYADISDLNTWTGPLQIAAETETTGIITDGSSILIAYGDCPIYYSTDLGATWSAGYDNTGALASAALTSASYVPGLDYKYFIFSDTFTYMSKNGTEWVEYKDLTGIEGVTFALDTLLIATKGAVYRDRIYNNKGTAKLTDIIQYLISAVDYLVETKANKV